jgi:hypothetical protein
MVEPFPGPGAPPGPPALPPAPPPPDRTALVLGVLGAALVVVLAISIPLVMGAWQERSGPASGTSSADLDEVHSFGGLSMDHTEDDVDYDHAPPVGGRHDPAWLDCGVYEEPVRDENAVHALEHGTVWITYTDATSEDDVAVLADALPNRGILSPYPSQDAPVVVTVWARQLELDGADDPRLALFIAEYGDGHTAPEPMASCVGGVRENAPAGLDV